MPTQAVEKKNENLRGAPSEARGNAESLRPGRSGQWDELHDLHDKAGNRAVEKAVSSIDRDSEGVVVPPIVRKALRSGRGQPLDRSTRREMESRFGHDFGNVRVHTDSPAADSARMVDAQAYTVGEHIVFANCQYSPQAVAGKNLLAHELTHVVQQGARAPASPPAAIRIAPASGEAEAQAQHVSPIVSHTQSQAITHQVPGLTPDTVTIPLLQRQPSSGGSLTELQHDIEQIKDELDSVIYTEGVEEKVIGKLRFWSGRGTLANGYLDWIFDALQTPKGGGVLGDTTYYDAMLDRFDRADEIRQLRAGSKRYRGKMSTQETHEAQQRKKREDERRETDTKADTEGKWVENSARPYELPSTPQNLYWAKLVIGRLEMIPSGYLNPAQKVVCERLSHVAVNDRPQEVLRQIHFLTESERNEERKARIRAVVEPVIELAAWFAAERVATFAIEAIAARLFAAEAGVAAAAAIGESEAAAGALARSSALEGGLTAKEGSMMVRGGYAYRIESIDALTGDITAVGKDLTTGEVAAVRMNIDSGVGVATRANGEILPIRGGRIDIPAKTRLQTLRPPENASPALSGSAKRSLPEAKQVEVVGNRAAGVGGGFEPGPPGPSAIPENALIERRLSDIRKLKMPSKLREPTGRMMEEIKALSKTDPVKAQEKLDLLESTLEEHGYDLSGSKAIDKEASEWLGGSRPSEHEFPAEAQEIAGQNIVDNSRFHWSMSEEELTVLIEERFPNYNGEQWMRQTVIRDGVPVPGGRRLRGSTIPEWYHPGDVKSGLPPISLESKNYLVGSLEQRVEFIEKTIAQAEQRARALRLSSAPRSLQPQQYLAIDIRGQEVSLEVQKELVRDFAEQSHGIFRRERIIFLTESGYVQP